MRTGMVYCCESCHRSTELIHCRATDEYLCEDCIMALAIAYYEARRERDDIDPPSISDAPLMMEDLQ